MSTSDVAQGSTEQSVIGRLAKRPYRDGDSLPEVGALCLVAGSNSDVESDQHRSYLWLKVIGYTDDRQFVCLQKPGCWPTVERLTNCWFADEESLVKEAAPTMLAALRKIVSDGDLTAPEGMKRIARDAIAKAEGRSS